MILDLINSFQIFVKLKDAVTEGRTATITGVLKNPQIDWVNGEMMELIFFAFLEAISGPI